MSSFCYVGLNQALAVYKSGRREMTCRARAFTEMQAKVTQGKWRFTAETVPTFIVAALSAGGEAERAKDLLLLPSALKIDKAASWAPVALTTLFKRGLEMAWGYEYVAEFSFDDFFASATAFDKAWPILLNTTAKLMSRMRTVQFTAQNVEDLYYLTKFSRPKNMAGLANELSPLLEAFAKKAGQKRAGNLIEYFCSDPTFKHQHYDQEEVAENTYLLAAALQMAGAVKGGTGLVTGYRLNKLQILKEKGWGGVKGHGPDETGLKETAGKLVAMVEEKDLKIRPQSPRRKRKPKAVRASQRACAGS